MVDLRLLEYVRTLHPVAEGAVTEWALGHVARQLSAAAPAERWERLWRSGSRSSPSSSTRTCFACSTRNLDP